MIWISLPHFKIKKILRTRTIRSCINEQMIIMDQRAGSFCACEFFGSQRAISSDTKTEFLLGTPLVGAKSTTPPSPSHPHIYFFKIIVTDHG